MHQTPLSTTCGQPQTVPDQSMRMATGHGSTSVWPHLPASVGSHLGTLTRLTTSRGQPHTQVHVYKANF